MSRRMSSSEFQRREFEKEVKKQLILVAEKMVIDEPSVTRRILRAYNIAEMRTALREEQQGGE